MNDVERIEKLNELLDIAIEKELYDDCCNILGLIDSIKYQIRMDAEYARADAERESK